MSNNIAMAAGFAGMIIFLVPAVLNRIPLNAGNYAGVLLSGALLLWSYAAGRYEVIAALIGYPLLFVLLVGAAETVLMICGALRNRPRAGRVRDEELKNGGTVSVRTGDDGADCPLPVVVLGCRVCGTRPSNTLRERLDTALRYLAEYPNAIAVLSGGKGSDEGISEAECMANYLTEHGVAPERLIQEDQSTTTVENLINSRKLLKAREALEKRGCKEDKDYRADKDGKVNRDEKVLAEDVLPLVIVTSEFHEFRALLIAKRLGIKGYPEPARTSLIYLPTYVVREWLAIVKLLVSGK